VCGHGNGQRTPGSGLLVTPPRGIAHALGKLQARLLHDDGHQDILVDQLAKGRVNEVGGVLEYLLGLFGCPARE
jgi:hypothetical protein